jgi:SNF2 family DNA or RNA helicase
MTDKPLKNPRAGITYMPHQEIGVRWMLDREDSTTCRGGVLADDMGLGKTFQTIGLLKNGLSLRTLIVCPPALITGWTDELRACGYSVSTLQGSVWTTTATATVYLTTYDKLTRYARIIALATEPFARVILDEGHMIRNGKTTARWRAAMLVGARATCRWILSATPIQNGHTDWINLCWFLRVRTNTESEMMALGPSLMLRRTMADLRSSGSLPAPNYVQHALHIGPKGREESRVFRALCDRLDDATLNPHISSLIVLELYLRIQQFLVHPQLYVEAMRRRGLVRDDWIATTDAVIATTDAVIATTDAVIATTDAVIATTTKWTAALTVIEDAIATSVPTIVFCQFQREMEMLEAAVTAAGGFPVRIRSGADVPTAARIAAAGEPVIVIVQIVAGGAGLNLQFCRRIVFLSQHWNPAVVHQAVGRAVRIGQTAVVDVHVFHIVDDVLTNLDHRMLMIHRAKINSARTVCSS